MYSYEMAFAATYPEGFPVKRCLITETFRKADRWLMGHDFNETPAPEAAPNRDGGPA